MEPHPLAVIQKDSIFTCGHIVKKGKWVALLFTEDEARNRPIPLDPYETNGTLESTGKLTGPFARLERPNVPSPSTGPGPPPDRTRARHGFDPGGFLEGVYSNPARSTRRRPFYEQGCKTGTSNTALLRKDPLSAPTSPLCRRARVTPGGSQQWPEMLAIEGRHTRLPLSRF
ncbi:hypothetical protein AVEN_149782-1 [Araneus ventricosus]|uniref:Uncharacterized protein n=1 Tax=Araneus ventricosus TaxID=182803 RepID=A0A4Y2KC96_ARAVE|nr:hypothetical protein AVEN_149782-1 [Araneus ventricosus]